MKKKTTITHLIAEIGLFAAIGFILDEIQGAYSISFTSGGSIGIAMIAVLVIAYRRGWLPAMLTGLIIGLFDLLSKAYIIHPAQVLLDYVLPYAVVGIAGFFKPFFDKTDDQTVKIKWLILGSVLGGLAKFVSHFLAGVIFWNDAAYFAWNLNYLNPFVYSLVYNIAYIGPSIILCTILLVVLFIKAKRIIMTEGSSEIYVKSVEHQRIVNQGIVALAITAIGTFLFIYFLIGYIKSFKGDISYYKFDKDCMLIFILGLFGMFLGGYLLFQHYKRNFKYSIACLGLSSLLIVFAGYSLAKIIDMYIEAEINNVYWAWFASALTLSGLFLYLFIIFKRKEKQIISAN